MRCICDWVLVVLYSSTVYNDGMESTESAKILNTRAKN